MLGGHRLEVYLNLEEGCANTIQFMSRGSNIFSLGRRGLAGQYSISRWDVEFDLGKWGVGDLFQFGEGGCKMFQSVIPTNLFGITLLNLCLLQL